MKTVQVCIELDEEDYRAYQAEAQREGTTVKALIEQVVRGLYRELQRRERANEDQVPSP